MKNKGGLPTGWIFEVVGTRMSPQQSTDGAEHRAAVLLPKPEIPPKTAEEFVEVVKDLVGFNNLPDQVEYVTTSGRRVMAPVGKVALPKSFEEAHRLLLYGITVKTRNALGASLAKKFRRHSSPKTKEEDWFAE